MEVEPLIPKQDLPKCSICSSKPMIEEDERRQHGNKYPANTNNFTTYYCVHEISVSLTMQNPSAERKDRRCKLHSKHLFTTTIYIVLNLSYCFHIRAKHFCPCFKEESWPFLLFRTRHATTAAPKSNEETIICSMHEKMSKKTMKATQALNLSAAFCWPSH